ncbi:CBS domain-containing protein [Haliangium sp.]|uniref:CBS domain-containing protein n=1 Tax=Haliangium sp. TaxID=2663208 RepID=UPI003D12EE5F
MSAGKDRTNNEESVAPDSRVTFEGIREVVVPLESASGSGEDADTRSPDPLARAHFACQPGGRVHSGLECTVCARFVNWLPNADGSQVTIRCLWQESDLVADLMTHLDGDHGADEPPLGGSSEPYDWPAWSVPPTATLGDVVTLMREQDTDIVAVVGADGPIGLISRDALVDAGLGAALDLG